MTSAAAAPRIAVISDGKAGHRNQSLGLADALGRLNPGLVVTELAPLPRPAALSRLLWPWRRREGYALLIGAGHGTHLSLLALGRVERCPTVILMRPSLPGSWFDLRIEPRHDGGVESAHCWLSDGPLNRMQPARERDGGNLILVGGPSPHYRWDAQALLGQLARICDGQDTWTLSSSRRTPADFMNALEDLALPGLVIHRAENLPDGWLAATLPRVACCWVSPDSASMVYESLTAGCAVGLLELDAERGSRVAAAVEDLEQRGLVTSYAAFCRGAELAPPVQGFAEADRCAARIVGQGWLQC